MKIRDSVFGSPPERDLYGTLRSRWAGRFNLYPSLPFTNIIDIQGADIKEGEKQYLFKTSVDVTLCGKETDEPIMSIDFDGLGHGFSHEGKYVQVRQSKDPFRKLKFDLKLRVTQKTSYPYVIVSLEETHPFSEDLELTIVDGIIGRILARKRFRELLKERGDELGCVGSERFMDFVERKNIYEAHGQQYTNNDYVQEQISSLESMADSEYNPISRQAWVLTTELMKRGIYEGEAVKFIEEPPAPVLRDISDLETLEKRIQALDDPFTKVGCEVSFKVKGLPKEISSRVLVRNLGSDFVSLPMEIARLLAAKKALVSWLTLSQ
jgi:hypothetical protein